jgi:hypothetical protein
MTLTVKTYSERENSFSIGTWPSMQTARVKEHVTATSNASAIAFLMDGIRLLTATL